MPPSKLPQAAAATAVPGGMPVSAAFLSPADYVAESLVPAAIVARTNRALRYAESKLDLPPTSVTALRRPLRVPITVTYTDDRRAGARIYTTGGAWLADAGFYAVHDHTNDYSIRANTVR